jgi:hypothetical protein
MDRIMSGATHTRRAINGGDEFSHYSHHERTKETSLKWKKKSCFCLPFSRSKWPLFFMPFLRFDLDFLSCIPIRITFVLALTVLFPPYPVTLIVQSHCVVFLHALCEPFLTLMSSALKTEAVFSSETLVYIQETLCRSNSQDNHRSSRRSENLRSWVIFMSLWQLKL